jgi:hypothetical protein
MKLRLARMSGRPVSAENLAAYEAEFKERYDKILEAHGNDMLTVHQELLKLDQELQGKWQRIEVEALPKSGKGWHELLEKFDAPVMLAKSSENVGELVLVIMDEPLA